MPRAIVARSLPTQDRPSLQGVPVVWQGPGHRLMDLPIRMMGYDLRQRHSELAKFGGQDRIYTVDAEIWSSAIDDSDAEDKGPQYLWCDLAELRAHARQVQPLQAWGPLIGIAMLPPILPTEDLLWRYYHGRVEQEPWLYPTVPRFARASWRLAGYDAADQFLTSGLHNCCLDHQVSLGAGTVASQLNEVGLFSSYPAASELALYLNHAVEGHAPFFVFAIFLTEALRAES